MNILILPQSWIECRHSARTSGELHGHFPSTPYPTAPTAPTSPRVHPLAPRSLTDTVLSAFPCSASFTPFAQRTQQMIKEQLGQAEDRTQLPDEYIELEKRVDALKLVHQKLLQVT